MSNKASTIFDDLMVERYTKNPEKHRISVGFTETGTEVNFGLKQMGNTLISGISRSGKTQLALHLLESVTKFADVAVYSVKPSDFFMFRDDVKIVDDSNTMSKLIRRTVGEIERRADRVRKASEKAGYVVECTEKPMIVMIDEFAAYSSTMDEATEIALEKIAGVGMGLNVYLYISCLLPSKKVMGDIRDQFITSISFRHRDRYGSQAAIGTSEATRLELRQCIVQNVISTFLVTSLNK